MRKNWKDEDIYDEGYGYPTTYYPPVRSTGGWKSRYGGKGWSTKSWSNFSYLIDYDLDDDNENLMVKDPVTYSTPSSRDIKNKVSGVRNKDAINMIKELSRVCYFKMIDEREYINENVDLIESKKNLYDSIFDQFIPGYTPLEQAISIYLKLKNKSLNEDGEEDDEEVDPNQSFSFDREIYSDPTINDQLELNEVSKDRKMEILNILSLVGKFGDEFKVEKEISEKIVANSDKFSKKIMRSHDQITMIDTYQRVLPTFDLKFLTKDLTVSLPVERKEQIQKIIIILDFSGSMSEDQKQNWVNGILIDRFKYVIKGEAEVFFSYFVDSPDSLDFQHITNKEEVIEFWRNFSNSPNGGMTEVGLMVERIAQEIENKRLMNLDIDLSEEKPEILIINDGYDDIHTSDFPYKVNAISLMEQNRNLRETCLKSGGRQIDVFPNNKVLSYSNSAGEQQITSN